MSGRNEREGTGDLWVKWKRKDWDWGPMGWVEGERTGLGNHSGVGERDQD